MIENKKEALEYIIKNKQIKAVFQPIISLKDGSILGHEALSRIACESIIENTELLFGIAGEYNRLWDLELLCRTKALEAAYMYLIPPYNKMLFLNVNPNTMHDENFKKGFTQEFLMQYHIEPHNIIFEITERNVILDMGSFLTTVNHYRNQNYQIAIDDAGAGYSGLNLISDINPNYIKLDMKLIRGIDKDNLKYALVKGMVELSRVSNINLIAEGIETAQELETLIKLGVQYGQGYYIQTPSAEIKEVDEEIQYMVTSLKHKIEHINESNLSNVNIKSICTYTQIVSSKLTASFVYQIFKQNPELFGLCIVDEDRPLGIITYEKLARKMSGHYGFSLYQNKPISELMEKNYLSVEHNKPIDTVAYLAMKRSNDSLYDFIVVTEMDKYIGTVTIKDLLQKTIEIEVDNAKHLNPLSGLPGNQLVEHKLNTYINSDNSFSVAYIDIDNFKAFNDVYGFEAGDIVIKLLANLLRSLVTKDHFIGHIGGDDFIVILNGIFGEDYFQPIIEQFQLASLRYHHLNDIKKGYLTTKNRRGEMECFPLISLTIVMQNNYDHNYKNLFELTEVLAEKKRDRKQTKLELFSRKFDIMKMF